MEESLSEDDSTQDRFEGLGFRPQKVVEYNNLLPYAEKLDDESNRILATIKSNLGRAVMLREICPGCRVWTARLMRLHFLLIPIINCALIFCRNF